ncbi:hypothetical protein PanWU01x14_149210 [Parasponia andersonii]|uniref:Uncharacterized protein n=1 Tax=Parasponia andersonii TaxID=3476 RepID=A0A2P5CIT8_PARAD|nr:hypothetical protein PanWU01x14_149210 [Parasponia andersonii]
MDDSVINHGQPDQFTYPAGNRLPSSVLSTPVTVAFLSGLMVLLVRQPQFLSFQTKYGSRFHLYTGLCMHAK